MCELCDKNGGEPEGCQICGTLICFDIEPGMGDDVMDRAFVTSGGDLYCSRCGMRMEQEEEESWDDLCFGMP